MNKRDLDKLIGIGEGLHLEFKSSPTHLGREICAFANSSGGHILLGVDDEGRIKGITNLNRVKSEVQATARTMDPPLALSIEAVDNVLVVNVPAGTGKPYSANGKFYLREAANSQQMRRDEIREFFFREGLIRFDEQVNKEFNMTRDFSVERYIKFIETTGISKGLQQDDVLGNLQILKPEGMTNAGALMFNNNPSGFFISAKVNCVLFQGKTKTRILDQQIYDGGIPEMFENAITYLKSHLNTEYIIKGGPREELLELPEEALREAVINAIVHRDYRLTGHIQIQIFQDRVEIVNPGGLVSGLNPDDLGRISLPRNPLLFALMHRMELVEHVGSGIKRIRDGMSEYGLSAPILESGDVWFSITFPRKPVQASIKDARSTGESPAGKSPDSDLKSSEKNRVKSGVTRVKSQNEGTEKSTEKTRSDSTEKSTEKILRCLLLNPGITISQLAGELDMSTSGIEKNLKKLKHAGKIKRVGPDKGGHWEVQQREES